MMAADFVAGCHSSVFTWTETKNKVDEREIIVYNIRSSTKDWVLKISCRAKTYRSASYFNPLKCIGIRWLRLKLLNAIQV